MTSTCDSPTPSEWWAELVEIASPGPRNLDCQLERRLRRKYGSVRCDISPVVLGVLLFLAARRGRYGHLPVADLLRVALSLGEKRAAGVVRQLAQRARSVAAPRPDVGSCGDEPPDPLLMLAHSLLAAGPSALLVLRSFGLNNAQASILAWKMANPNMELTQYPFGRGNSKNRKDLERARKKTCRAILGDDAP